MELTEASMRVVQMTELESVLDTRAEHLSHGMRQALELAMVLALEPSVLLLDEPTAGLSNPERSSIGAVLADLAHEHDLCLVLVEHDLDFVRRISTRLVVLHQGEVVLDGTVADVADSAVVRSIYVG